MIQRTLFAPPDARETSTIAKRSIDLNIRLP